MWLGPERCGLWPCGAWPRCWSRPVRPLRRRRLLLLLFPSQPPVVTWEEKLGWILRLEDQRLLRDPNPPPPVVLVPATRTQPAIVAPPAPSDLIRLLGDSEARVRRRAALALGRVGLRDARRAADEAVERRLRARSAPDGGVCAWPCRRSVGPHSAACGPCRSGSAGGGARRRGAWACWVCAPMRRRSATWCCGTYGPGPWRRLRSDDLAYPLAPPVEAARLGLYALVRLGSYEALAAAALDASGRPVSTWWPVAYALQRLGDHARRACPHRASDTPGRYTPALCRTRARRHEGDVGCRLPLRQIVERRAADPAVVIQAIRAAAAIAGRGRRARSDTHCGRRAGRCAPSRRGDDCTGRGRGTRTVWTSCSTCSRIRSPTDSRSRDAQPCANRPGGLSRHAVRAGRRIATGPSAPRRPRHWDRCPRRQGVPALMALLEDRDPRVVPAVLSALVAAKAPGVGQDAHRAAEERRFRHARGCRQRARAR